MPTKSIMLPSPYLRSLKGAGRSSRRADPSEQGSGEPSDAGADVLGRAASWSMRTRQGLLKPDRTNHATEFTKGDVTVDSEAKQACVLPALPEHSHQDPIADQRAEAIEQQGASSSPQYGFSTASQVSEDFAIISNSAAAETSLRIRGSLPTSGSAAELPAISAEPSQEYDFHASTRSRARRSRGRPMSRSTTAQGSAKPSTAAVGLMRELVSMQQRLDDQGTMHKRQMNELNKLISTERSAAEEAIGRVRSGLQRRLAQAEEQLSSWKKRCLESERRTQELRGKLFKVAEQAARGDQLVQPNKTKSRPGAGSAAGSGEAARGTTADTSIRIVELENARRELKYLKLELDHAKRQAERQATTRARDLDRAKMLHEDSLSALEEASMRSDIERRTSHETAARIHAEAAQVHERMEQSRESQAAEVHMLESKVARLEAQADEMRHKHESLAKDLATKTSEIYQLKSKSGDPNSVAVEASAEDSDAASRGQQVADPALAEMMAVLQKCQQERDNAIEQLSQVKVHAIDARSQHSRELTAARQELQDEVKEAREAVRSTETSLLKKLAEEQTKCRNMQASLHEQQKRTQEAYYQLGKLRLDRTAELSKLRREAADAAEQSATHLDRLTALTVDRDAWRSKCEELMSKNEDMYRAIDVLEGALSRLDSRPRDDNCSDAEVENRGNESDVSIGNTREHASSQHRKVVALRFLHMLQLVERGRRATDRGRLLYAGWRAFNRGARDKRHSNELRAMKTEFNSTACSVQPAQVGMFVKVALSCLRSVAANAGSAGHRSSVSSSSTTLDAGPRKRRHSIAGTSSRVSLASGMDSSDDYVSHVAAGHSVSAVAQEASSQLEQQLQAIKQQQALVRASQFLLEQDRWQLREASEKELSGRMSREAAEMKANFEARLQEHVGRARRHAYETARAELESDHAIALAREKQHVQARLDRIDRDARKQGRSACEAELRSTKGKLRSCMNKLRNAQDIASAVRAASDAREGTPMVHQSALDSMAKRHGDELGAMAQRMQDLVAQLQVDMVRERELVAETTKLYCEASLSVSHQQAMKDARRRFQDRITYVTKVFEERATAASKEQFALECELRRLKTAAETTEYISSGTQTDRSGAERGASDVLCEVHLVHTSRMPDSGFLSATIRSAAPALELALMSQEDRVAVERQAATHAAAEARSGMQADHAFQEGLEQGRAEGREQGTQETMRVSEAMRLEQLEKTTASTEKMLERERKSRADAIKRLKQASKEQQQAMKEALKARHAQEMRKEMKVVALKASERVRSLEVEVNVLRGQCDSLVTEADLHRDNAADLDRYLVACKLELKHVRQCGTALRARLFMAAMKYAGLHLTVMRDVKAELWGRIRHLRRRYDYDTEVLKARTEVAAERARELEYLLGRVSKELCVTNELRAVQRKQHAASDGSDGAAGSENRDADSDGLGVQVAEAASEVSHEENRMLKELRAAMQEASTLRSRIDAASRQLYEKRRDLVDTIAGYGNDQGALRSLKEELKANLYGQKQMEARLEPGEAPPIDEKLVQRLRRLERQIAFHQSRSFERYNARTSIEKKLEVLKDERRAWKLKLRAIEGRTLSAVVQQHDATRQLILAAGLLEADGVVKLLERVPGPRPLILSPIIHRASELESPFLGSESGRSTPGGAAIRLGRTPPPETPAVLSAARRTSRIT